MTLTEIQSRTGITRVNYLSPTTVVLEYLHGNSCRPATTTEIRMWELLETLAEE